MPAFSTIAIFALVFFTPTIAFQSTAYPLPFQNMHDDQVHADPPNIIVIMLDDLDHRSLDEMLNAGLLPNIKSNIIDKAIEFTKFYVTNPVCCPSRSTYLSGQYTHNNGILANYMEFETEQPLAIGPRITEDGLRSFPNDTNESVSLGAVGNFDDSTTIATRLQALGYNTVHIGKYLNGYGQYPGYSDISPAFVPTYIPPGWTGWYGLIDGSTYCVYNYEINENGTVRAYDLEPGQTESDELYQARTLEELAGRYLRNNLGTQPIFMSLTPLQPHAEVCADAYTGDDPPATYDTFRKRIRPAPRDKNTIVPEFLPGPSFDEDLSDKPNWIQAFGPMTNDDLTNIQRQHKQRLQSLISVDRMVRTLFRALGAHVSRTTFILTSDNGWMYGDHRLGGKVASYEESSRVPLYVRTPGMTQARVVNGLITNTDLAPTILDLAGDSTIVPEYDGRSFKSLIANPNAPWTRRRFLLEHWRQNPDPNPDDQDHPTYGALHGTNTVYIETSNVVLSEPDTPPSMIGWEWYDLSVDPNEMESKVRGPGDADLGGLPRALRSLQRCAGASCKTAEDNAL